jgi:hypothetical protein
MKRVISICTGWILAVGLSACPYCSSHGLDDNPNIYVEDALLGNWNTFLKKPNDDKTYPVTLSLSKKNDTEYKVLFSGYVDQLRPFKVVDTGSVAGSAFMSTVDGRQFLNITIKSRTYIAELQFQNDRLSLLPLAEHFTSKMIFTSEALRNSVSFHYKSRVHPVYDDDFCLKDMVKGN